MADELRADARRIVERLRAEGVRAVAMVSGDRRSVAERIGRELGVDRVYSEQSPEDKLEVVRRLREDPALAPGGDGRRRRQRRPGPRARGFRDRDGSAGATVSSETADAVITVDRIDRVADAVHAGRRALAIARQSVLVGWASACGDGRRRRWLPPPGRRRAAAGGDRPRGDPQRPAGAAGLIRPRWVPWARRRMPRRCR